MNLDNILGKRNILPFCTWAIEHIAQRTFSSRQINGLDNVVTKIDFSQPVLWLPKHESYFDVISLPPLWRHFPGRPAVRLVSRPDYINIERHPHLSRILSTALSTFMTGTLFFEVHRVGMMEELTEDQKKQYYQQNEETLNHLGALYDQGMHIAILPEGTSKSDGKVMAIKNGAYKLCREDVPCIPVVNTYDMMGEKYKVFSRFMEPFYHSPDKYNPEDREKFKTEIRASFIAGNTLTTAQLTAEYLVRMVDEEKSTFSEKELVKIITDRVNALRDIEGMIFDNDLLHPSTLSQCVSRVFNFLKKDGYVKDGYIEQKKVHFSPQNLADFKSRVKGNVVLYSANRLIQVAEENYAVNEILEVY